MQAKDNCQTGEIQPLLAYRGWGYSPPVDSKVFTTIAVTGFSVAFFHAAIPTHWLPFVLTARVQKWSKARTLAVTTLAGCGHVLFTAVLGFLVAWGGIKLSDKIGGWFPWIAGGALIAFGLYYVIQQIRGKGQAIRICSADTHMATARLSTGRTMAFSWTPATDSLKSPYLKTVCRRSSGFFSMTSASSRVPRPLPTTLK